MGRSRIERNIANTRGARKVCPWMTRYPIRTVDIKMLDILFQLRTDLPINLNLNALEAYH